MTKRDVIITVFANSTQSPYELWAKEYFSEPPIILTVPGNGGSDFRAHAQAWAKTGDCFRAALKQLKPEYKDVEIGRRGLITFSVGWSFFDVLGKFPNEIEDLDAYLLLDGCHTNDLKSWTELAVRAAKLDSFMTMVHTQIKPPFISTTETNNKIFNQAKSIIEADSTVPLVETELPEYISNTELANSITISLGGSPGLNAIKKTWNKDPLISYKNLGNLTLLELSGIDRPDHVFVAWYSSKKVFRMLGEHWSR